jgi:hypothetical protein
MTMGLLGCVSAVACSSGGPTTVGDALAGGKPLGDPGKQPETPVGPQTNEVESYSDGTSWTCTVQQYTLADDPETFVTLDPNAAVIWPGSLLQGGSLASGSPEPVAVKRGGGTIVMNLVNSGTGVTAKSYQVDVPEITQGNVIDAQNQILSNNVGKTPAAFDFTYERVESEEQMALAMDVNVSWLSGSAQASLKFSTDQHYTRYLVKLTQQYYTMVFQTPTSPSDLFDPSVTGDDVSRFVGPDNPVTYISSITYGRQFYLLFESTASAQDLESSLKMSYDGGFTSATADVQASFKKTEAETTVKAYAVGGAADSGLNAALQAANGQLEGLHDYIVKGSNFGADNPGLPLSYVVRDANTQEVVHAGITGQYAKKTCVPVVKDDGRLVLWLDATTLDTNGTADMQPVTQWPGKTMAANDGIGQAQFAKNGIGGHPAAWFTKSNGVGGGPWGFAVDLGTGIVAKSDYTIFMVARTAGTMPVQASPNDANFLIEGANHDWTDNDLHIGWMNATDLRFGHWNDDLNATVTPSVSGDIIVARYSQKEGKWLWMNGVNRASDMSQTTALVDNVGSGIGAAPGSGAGGFVGYMGEVKAYNYALDDAERMTVECALGQKWGIGVADCIDGQPDPQKVTF